MCHNWSVFSIFNYVPNSLLMYTNIVESLSTPVSESTDLTKLNHDASVPGAVWTLPTEAYLNPLQWVLEESSCLPVSGFTTQALIEYFLASAVRSFTLTASDNPVGISRGFYFYSNAGVLISYYETTRENISIKTENVTYLLVLWIFGSVDVYFESQHRWVIVSGHRMLPWIGSPCFLMTIIPGN